jgi:hypothetical protein
MVHWTVRGLAGQLGIEPHRLYPLLRSGKIPAKRHSISQSYLIDDDPDIVARARQLLHLGET